MAEEAVLETTTERNNSADMDLETVTASKPNGVDSAVNGDSDSDSKRAREEEEEKENGGAEKKQKVEKSVEEERLETAVEGSESAEGEKESGRASVGPKEFGSAEDLFDYFFKFLHFWPPNLDVNKYEYLMLLDLLKKGHTEPDKKIGGGIQAFQVRYHPTFKSRCFFLVREDESVDDFSFRKCVDHILPLPENMKLKTDVNKSLGGRSDGGGKRGGFRGRGRGRGGGKWRN